MTRPRAVALGCGVALVALGVVLLLVAANGSEPKRVGSGESPVQERPERSSEPNKQAQPSAQEPRTQLPPNQDPATGPSIARVRIPSIDVNAPLIKLGLNPNGTLQVPGSTSRTGWWRGGAFPGEPGAAVIAGHVDSLQGPAVFYRLRELSAGDEIIVAARDGSRSRFVVTRSEQHPKTKFPTDRVYSDGNDAVLRLITCEGPFNEDKGHYRDNLIVYGRAA